jgi:hypothetical protein
MVLEFGAKNFYSFKEGFEVSMRLGDGCPESISKGKSYANAIAVKGANASGKTNVLKVLYFLREFATNSFNKKPDSKIEFHSFFNNTKPTELYIVFLDNDIEYRYELTLINNKIISEVLYRKAKRENKIIERKDNELDSRLEEFSSLDIIKLRDNASIISTSNQYDIVSMKTIYNLFSNIFTNVNSLGLDNKNLSYLDVSKFYYKENDIFRFVTNTLMSSDIGLENIKIIENLNKETNEKEYFPVFEYLTQNKNNNLMFMEQSSGTKALYLQLGLYKLVLNTGGTLVLDEFDINLHADLLPMLIDFFDDEEKNPNNAQLIFTTHHTDIMDKLGKYRVVLVNKEDNESFLYRLDEIPGDMLRNDRSIVQKYKEGKIGGKPRLDYEKV